VVIRWHCRSYPAANGLPKIASSSCIQSLDAANCSRGHKKGVGGTGDDAH